MSTLAPTDMSIKAFAKRLSEREIKPEPGNAAPGLSGTWPDARCRFRRDERQHYGCHDGHIDLAESVARRVGPPNSLKKRRARGSRAHCSFPTSLGIGRFPESPNGREAPHPSAPAVARRCSSARRRCRVQHTSATVAVGRNERAGSVRRKSACGTRRREGGSGGSSAADAGSRDTGSGSAPHAGDARGCPTAWLDAFGRRGHRRRYPR